jgi:hypothetical protein
MAMCHASTEEELADLSGMLGDAWFDIDRVSPDAKTRTLTIPFAQEWEWDRCLRTLSGVMPRNPVCFDGSPRVGSTHSSSQRSPACAGLPSSPY